MKIIYDMVALVTLSLCVFSSSGCAVTSQSKQLSNSTIIMYPIPSSIKLESIIVTDRQTVVGICGHGLEFWDDGTKVLEEDKKNIGACYIPSAGVMVLDIKHPEHFLHELCHASGTPKEVCARTAWPRLEELSMDLTTKESRAIIYKEIKNARDKRVIKLP